MYSHKYIIYNVFPKKYLYTANKNVIHNDTKILLKSQLLFYVNCCPASLRMYQRIIKISCLIISLSEDAGVITFLFSLSLLLAKPTRIRKYIYISSVVATLLLFYVKAPIFSMIYWKITMWPAKVAVGFQELRIKPHLNVVKPYHHCCEILDWNYNLISQ